MTRPVVVIVVFVVAAVACVGGFEVGRRSAPTTIQDACAAALLATDHLRDLDERHLTVGRVVIRRAIDELYAVRSGHLRLVKVALDRLKTYYGGDARLHAENQTAEAAYPLLRDACLRAS